MVQGSYHSFIEYDNLFKTHGLLIQGELIGVDTINTYILFKSMGETTQFLKYDYLIIATGSTLNQFRDSQSTDIQRSISSISLKLTEANNVAILGAGATGLVLAGEIRDSNPDVNVEVIGKTVLSNPSGLPNYVRDDVKRQLKDYNIKHIPHYAKGNFRRGSWDERIVFDTEVEYDESKTKYDVVINCTGQDPNSSWTINGKSSKDYFEVDGYLQNKDYDKVWFVGDCNKGSLNKLAGIAEEQGKYAANSILRLINGEHALEYMTSEAIEGNIERSNSEMYLPLTKQGGFGYFGGIQFPVSIMHAIYGQDLMVGKLRGDLNAIEPCISEIDDVQVLYWESKYQFNNIRDSVLCVKSLLK
eukprot:Mrub_04525.p1 GENE.Mrub_04525~~Mrub_04525.p1  ORF type:complete len:401 (-),score=65.54 Mrub_04525:55-1131(-)